MSSRAQIIRQNSFNCFYLNKNMSESAVALITGVSRQMGMGYETARQLARQGYHVILTSRELFRARELAYQLQQEGLAVTAQQPPTVPSG
jgi:short-subunit dehydrogenase